MLEIASLSVWPATFEQIYFSKLMFAQKHACDYARGRLKELGLENLYWGTDLPDLTNPLQKPEQVYDPVD